MHTFDGRIGGNDDFCARGYGDHGSVVADLLRRLSPLCQKRSDEIEFFAGAQIYVAVVRVLVRHVGTAGRLARMGADNARSFSFQARGSAYKTSSIVVPRTYSQNSAARPWIQAAQPP